MTAYIGTLELRSELQAVDYLLADLAECYGSEAEYARFIVQQRRDNIARHVQRHERVQASGVVSESRYPTHGQWEALAADVRAHADIVEIFSQAGIVLCRAGYSRRRDAEEWAGPCFVCGGVDRFRVWRGENGGYWCRRCGVAGDVINAVRNLIPGCDRFYAAVAYLGRLAGLPLPEPEQPKLSPNGFDYVGGKVVPR